MSILKKIELFAKKIISPKSNSFGEPIFVFSQQNIFNESNCNRILLLRQDRIGDLLISVPFIKKLRNILPKAKIDILLGEKNISAKKPLLQYIDSIYIFKKKLLEIFKLIRILRNNKYDLIIDLFDNSSTTSSLLISKLKPKYSLGFQKENSNLYTHIVPLPDKNKIHIVERLFSLLLPFNYDFLPENEIIKLEYPISAMELEKAFSKTGKKIKRFRLGINLSGSDRTKFWGVNNFIDLINLFNNYYKEHEVFIYYTSGYINEAIEIEKNSVVKKAPLSNSFDEFAAMLKTCDIIFTPDTSAVHLAAAWQIPCIALFSYYEGNFGMPWIPYNSPGKNIIAKNSGINALNPTSVFNEIKSFLDNIY